MSNDRFTKLMIFIYFNPMLNKETADPAKNNRVLRLEKCLFSS